jgi:AcrR family transcriptional regulator
MPTTELRSAATETPAPRARRRARLAAEIEAVALELFASRGFNAVTIDEIAAAADISQRTFFRYFATKEEVVLGGIVRRIDHVVVSLGGRPVEESPVTSLRAALTEIADAESFGSGRVEHWRTTVMLAEPAIADRGLQLLMAKHDEMVAIVARRMAVDPLADLRAGVVTAAMVGALAAGWRAGVARGRIDPLPSLTAEALDLVVPALDRLTAPA